MGLISDLCSLPILVSIVPLSGPTTKNNAVATKKHLVEAFWSIQQAMVSNKKLDPFMQNFFLDKKPNINIRTSFSMHIKRHLF